MIRNLLFVALGGGLGSVLRYLTSFWMGKSYSSAFPLGTFIINVLGCFVIGFLIGLSSKTLLNEELRLLLVVGFCGGYTTFSTFSAENMKLLETGNYLTLTLYIVASVLLGLIAVWGGNTLSKIISL
jgi:crcB protein